MKREETIDYIIKKMWHGINKMYNQFGASYGITTSTGFVLLNINEEKGTPATKIAPLLGMESRSLTRMLKNLEKKGWIYREKDKSDGRSVRIFLTKLGIEKRKLSAYAVKEFNKKINELVECTQLKQFFKTASQINNIIDNSPTLFESSYKNFIAQMDTLPK